MTKRTETVASKPSSTTPRELLNTLLNDPILLERFRDPVIASDMNIYSQASYESCRAQNNLSPLTREPFLGAPFPVAFLKLNKFIQSATTQNLYDFVKCPLTHHIMENPCKAYLTFSDFLDQKTAFIIVCDASALQSLPGNVKLIKATEWDDLKAVISEPTMRKSLDAIDAMQPRQEIINDPDLRWEIAMLQSRDIDFTMTQPPTSNSTTVYRAAIQQQPIEPPPPTTSYSSKGG